MSKNSSGEFSEGKEKGNRGLLGDEGVLGYETYKWKLMLFISIANEIK